MIFSESFGKSVLVIYRLGKSVLVNLSFGKKCPGTDIFLTTSINYINLNRGISINHIKIEQRNIFQLHIKIEQRNIFQLHKN